MKLSINKYTIVLVLCALFMQTTAFAQRGGRVKERLEKLRKNIYTRELALTDEEAPKFWAIFDKMQAEIKVERKSIMTAKKDAMANLADYSDEQLSALADKIYASETKILEIKKKYHEEFKKVISIRKVILMPKAEREFQKKVLKLLVKFRKKREAMEDGVGLDVDE